MTARPGRARLREEMRTLLVNTAFFSTMFCLIVVTDRLLIRGSSITIAGFATAIVGGLLVAKVVLLVNLLPFVDEFRDRPLVYGILWKTPIYFAAVLLFRYVEPVLRAIFARASLVEAEHRAAEQFAQPRFWAVGIWVAVLLVLFVTMQELARLLGSDHMREMFFGRPGDRRRDPHLTAGHSPIAHGASSRSV
jgi:hypothetical protein